MRRIFVFGPFQVDEGERLLSRDGAAVPTAPKAFDTLLLLLEHPGKLVERKKLLDSVWPDVFVEDAVLTRTISDLRKALQQSEHEVWIETVPKFGYRFVAAVTQIEEAGPPTVQAPAAAPEASRGPAPAKSNRFGWSLGLAAGALILLLITQRPTSRTDPGLAEVHHLAILPFQTLEQSSKMETLELGVADALITRLSNLTGLIVRPISSVRRYVGSTADPIQAGRDLKVDAVVEGTLQSIDGGIRASVRVIRARDGKALWAGTVDSPSGGHLFALEDSIAQQVALRLSARLTEAERRSLGARRELNPQAHELYVKGRYEWGKRSREGFERAAEYFRQAIDLDPTYARAHAGLADCYLLLGGYSHYPQLEMLPRAKTMASRALELDRSLAEAHATLGLISQNLDWEWGEVEDHYQKAISLAPNYATARHWHAEFLSILGRFEESRREFEEAREIDPISPIIQIDEAQLYFFEKKFDQSLAILRQVAQLDPSFELAHERMAFTYMVQGREEEAWKEAQFLRACQEATSDCRQIWTAYLPRRNPQAARQALRRLETEAKRRRIPPAAFVFAYARHGEPGRALDWLEYMLDKHEVWLITAKVNPLFDPLRSQPRFQKLLQGLRLKP